MRFVLAGWSATLSTRSRLWRRNAAIGLSGRDRLISCGLAFGHLAVITLPRLGGVPGLPARHRRPWRLNQVASRPSALCNKNRTGC
jgi:hypothetical protein